jgi:hypothetical protein
MEKLKRDPTTKEVDQEWHRRTQPVKFAEEIAKQVNVDQMSDGRKPAKL